MRLTNEQIVIVVNGLIATMDDVPDIQLDMLLERLQEKCLQRHLKYELELVQDALKRRKRPRVVPIKPLLYPDSAA